MANITEIAPLVSATFSLFTAIVVVIFGRRTAQQIEKIKTLKDTLNIKLDKLQNALEKSRMRIDLSDPHNVFHEIQKQYFLTQDQFEIIKHFIGKNNLKQAEALEHQITSVYISRANEKIAGKIPVSVDANELGQKMTDYYNLVSKILTEEIQAILSKLEG